MDTEEISRLIASLRPKTELSDNDKDKIIGKYENNFITTLFLTRYGGVYNNNAESL